MTLQCMEQALEWEKTLKVESAQGLVGDMPVEEVAALAALGPVVVGSNMGINYINGNICNYAFPKRHYSTHFY